jgi:acetyltransferase
MTIRKISTDELPHYLESLVQLLQDAVDYGASVGFLPPLAADEAQEYWRGVADALTSGHRLLWIAEQDGRALGTVQLDLATKPNGLHRAEVAKLLVHTQARRQGIARQLMQTLEAEAHRQHRTTLVLDTLQGEPSELLYQQLSYKAAGAIPAFARIGSGELCATVVYYKLLA